MPELKFLAQAPSNIALIKYMGKKDAALNLPENPSLSMTLDSLRTWVELSRADVGTGSTELRWIPEAPRGLPERDSRGQAVTPQLRVPALKEEGIARVRRHFERARSLVGPVLTKHGLSPREGRARGGAWTLRTANTFPPESGIASSASSFAAITLATALAEAADAEALGRALAARDGAELRRDLAGIARQGSGSSCRSFDGPWVHWEEDRATPVAASAALPALHHFVLLVSEGSKAVSSSEAHRRVKTSPLWDGRVRRVESRAARLREALVAGDLPLVARVAWGEAWEMHSLFHTSAEPFTYWEPVTVSLLTALSPFVSGAQPPIVTLDAGPNVHLTVERDQAERWRGWLREKFPTLRYLEDAPGVGARFVGEVRE